MKLFLPKTFKFLPYLILAILLSLNFNSFGQTNPAAFNLSGGSFSFTTQTATNTTYPTNMQGWTTGTNNITAITTAAPGADQALVASGSATTSGLSNLGVNGFNFLSTSSSPNQQVGAIVVALNATGRKNLLATWTAADQTTGSTRQMNLTLQYRLGTTGTFTNVASSTYTTSNTAQLAAQTFTNIALPSACDNQSVVQLRWISYESAAQSGGRDAVRLDDITISSSNNTPTLDGNISASEYGTHTDGSNQQTSGSPVTYMTWDDTNLYVGVSAANTAEAFVLYLDKDPQSLVNGGTNANGTNVGFNYDGTSFAELQYRADIVMYVKNGYREYRTADGSNGWSGPTAAFGAYAESGGTVREFSIPWSAMGGKPSAFNFFNYVTSSGGFVYGQTPTENAGGTIGTSARYARYYTVSSTTSGSSTLPFSRNSYVFNSASDISSFGPISAYDFTMNTSGRLLSRTGSGTTSGNWTIAGNLNVGNGTIYLGSGAGPFGTTAIAGNLNITGGTFDMDATTGAVSVTGNVSVSTGATLKLSTAVGGDLNLAGNWSSTGTFTPSSRQVNFNGTVAQTLTGATTFDYLKINNATGLTLQAASAVTINNEMDLTLGKVTLGVNNFTMGSTATFVNNSATSYIVTNSTGALVRNSFGATARPFPVGLAASYTPLTIANTGTTNNLSLVVSSPPVNAVSNAARIVNLQWDLNSAGAGSVADVTFNWNTPSNVGASYTATGTGELGNYTAGPNYAITSIGTMAGTSKAVTGITLASGSNKLVLGNTSAVYLPAPANDLCSNAVNLTIDAAATNGTMLGATPTSGNTFVYASTKNDVWYKFTPVNTGTHTISINFTTGPDIDFDVFTTTCPTGGTATQISHGSGTTSEINSFSFNSGTTYYIRVIDYNTNANAFTINVAGPPATLNTSVATLSFSNSQAVLSQSVSQSFNINGFSLTGAPGNITVSAPNTNYQVSNNNSTWGATTTIAYASATLAATPVYVRFTPQSSGTKTGNVTFSGGGVVTPPTVALDGTGVLPAPVAIAATNITATPTFDANWNAVSGATSGYLLDVSTSATFGTSTPTTLTEAFTSYTGGGSLNGFTFTGTSFYTSAGSSGIAPNSVSFNTDGAVVLSPVLSGPATGLNFYLKGNSTDGISALLVQGFNGTTWVTIQNILVSLTGSTFTYNSGTTPAMPLNITQFRFTYSKSSGNTAFDDVIIDYNLVSPSFVSGYNAKPIAGQATVTSTVSGLVADTVYYYRLRATDGTPSAYSNVITVNPASRGGSVAADQTICSGANPATLTLSGHYGSVIRWESSADAAFTSPTTITNTTTTLTGASIGALTATTYFRAVVQSGTNPTANSASVTITVNPTTVGGTVTGGTTICSGSTSGVLTLTGNTGSVVRWEKSVSPFSSWTTIANTTLTHTSVALTETTQFRAVVQSGVCTIANSATTTVTVNPTSVGGTVSGGTTICSGSTSGVLTLTGNTGSIVRWEKSVSPFSSWTTIANTTSTHTSVALTETTQFRAVVQSGVCAEENSATTTVTVSPTTVGGSVTGGTTICNGSTSGLLTLGGNIGSVVRWESSTSPFLIWTTIANTSNTYTSGVLLVDTQFRAVVQSGVCLEANSAFTTVTVSPITQGGTVTGGTSICTGSTSGLLTLSGNTASVVRWESSVSPFLVWTTIANTSSTYASGTLSETTKFRAVVQSGVCPEANSTDTTVSIDTTTWDGTSWSPGTPTSTTAVIFTGNYSVASSFDACSVTVTNNAVVSIPSGNSVTISGIITVDSGSTFTLESNANLVQTAAGTNVGSITVKRATSSLKRLDYVLWSTPVLGQELLAFSPLTTATRFYTYDASSNIYVAITPSGNDFAAATGYLIRMPNNHSASGATWLGTFNGVPNNGTHSVSVASGTYNAVGNPYPTTISADDFITDNSLTEALYFWRKTNSATITTSSYATYTLAGGAGTSNNTGGGSSMTPNGTIQVGQGFIAKATSGSLDFTNSMKTDNHGDQFFRVNSPIERNRIWLNMSGENGVFGQMLVAYMTNATQGIDAAIDGRYINDSPIALNSIIENEEFTIQGRSLPFETTDVVPLGFKTTIAGNYTFAIDHTDGLFLNEDVAIYLKDNATNTVHNLRNGAYSFASETGNFTSRFEIVYQNILGVTQPTFDANSVAVYTQHDNIIVSSNLTDIKQVTVYDLRGRKLLSVDAVNATTTTINASSIANQVLLVKVTSVDGVSITKKIIK